MEQTIISLLCPAAKPNSASAVRPDDTVNLRSITSSTGVPLSLLCYDSSGTDLLGSASSSASLSIFSDTSRLP